MIPQSLQARIDKATEQAKRQYPDAEKIQAWWYGGDVGVWIFRQWGSVYEGRSFALVGETL